MSYPVVYDPSCQPVFPFGHLMLQHGFGEVERQLEKYALKGSEWRRVRQEEWFVVWMRPDYHVVQLTIIVYKNFEHFWEPDDRFRQFPGIMEFVRGAETDNQAFWSAVRDIGKGMGNTAVLPPYMQCRTSPTPRPVPPTPHDEEWMEYLLNGVGNFIRDLEQRRSWESAHHLVRLCADPDPDVQAVVGQGAVGEALLRVFLFAPSFTPATRLYAAWGLNLLFDFILPDLVDTGPMLSFVQNRKSPLLVDAVADQLAMEFISRVEHERLKHPLASRRQPLLVPPTGSSR